MSLSLTSILLDDDAAIAAKAVAELVAAQTEFLRAEKAKSEAQRPNAFVRIRAAIADYQGRETGGAWPNYASKAAVREIAKAANAPADLTRHILRHPDCSLGRST